MLHNALLTASLTGQPFIRLLSDRSQQFHGGRLIQPAPTSPNDASGYAGLFDDGVAGDPDQYRDFP